MTLKKDIRDLGKLGDHLKSMPEDQLYSLAARAASENVWFTPENVKRALTGATNYLNQAKLEEWISHYPSIPSGKSLNIGLVLAGNIPLVGLHDILSVLVSGHHAIVKPSSKDSVLLTYLLDQLAGISPALASRITLTERLTEMDAIIATGSDNTARYFHQYFSRYPNIIRKNRTSMAILTGNESPGDLQNLGVDIFSYFGLGCRNVAKLLVPENYVFNTFYENIAPFFGIMDHNKYHNNYDYNKSILLVNNEKHFDNGFLLLHPSKSLVSPISVLFFEHYKNEKELDDYIGIHREKLQCVVSTGGWYKGSVAMGQTQMPELWDYADNADTLEFLLSL